MQKQHKYVTGQNHTQINIFETSLILNFLCLLALIHEKLGLGDKGDEESTMATLFFYNLFNFFYYKF